MAFRPPDHLIVKETSHWLVNHRVESKLPGYLMVGAKAETTDISALPTDALAGLGPLLAATQKALSEILHPAHFYIRRYGHTSGYSIHFHVIPICDWVVAAFAADSRYRVLRSFYNPKAPTSDPDGAELTLYVWREFCESTTPPVVKGPGIDEVVAHVRKALA